MAKIKKIIEEFPPSPEDLWEDKTKINGVWVNDKDLQGEPGEDE